MDRFIRQYTDHIIFIAMPFAAWAAAAAAEARRDFNNRVAAAFAEGRT